MKIVLLIFRLLVGVLFVFSGFVKLVDPVGTQIKLEEYFQVFSEDIAGFFSYFIPIALPLSVLFCVLEVVLGIALLIQYRMKITAVLLLLIIAFFTFLTFYSAYFNKVTDCGCFGDFMKLEPWHSFWKDVALLVPITFLFIYRNQLEDSFSFKIGSIVTGIATVICFYIAIHAINHDSVIDFRAYKVGTNIPTAMQPSAPLRFKYIMEKNGKIEEFEKYPTDTTYKYKSMELVNPEAQAKIKDYALWNNEGDYTQESFKGNQLLIGIGKVDKAKLSNMSRIQQLIHDVRAKYGEQVKIVAVTTNETETFENFRHEYQLDIPYYFIDEKVLKTMTRANPSIILMQNGTIKAKWHSNDTPSIEELERKM
jgi:uncharacterized membrane protein YphA (DoxX/SURF4 family)